MTARPHDIERLEAPAGWKCGVIRPPRDGMAPAAASGGRAAAACMPSLVVLKFGGSLLSRPNWPALLATLLVARGPASCCLVVGGGAVVDGLRELDRAVPQAPALVHALAIDAMPLTARLVAAAIDLPLVAAPPDHGAVAVLDVPAWLAVASRTTQLPAGWGVTSDSIAAVVAASHGGSLLVAKSVPPPPCPEDVEPLSALARAGWVDEHFPVAAAGLGAIRWAAPDG